MGLNFLISIKVVLSYHFATKSTSTEHTLSTLSMDECYKEGLWMTQDRLLLLEMPQSLTYRDNSVSSKSLTETKYKNRLHSLDKAYYKKASNQRIVKIQS